MINKSKKIKFLTLVLFAIGFFVSSGSLPELRAQNRDPFEKPSWAKPKDPNAKPSTTTVGKDGKVIKPGPPPVVPVGIPAIQDRIAYYKRIREDAAANGQPVPKPTVVMTLEEMSITGIFRTPRGMAAMVQATPINLSYTIYPGEKFFNGQLVAIEENRLVFRKVMKMSDGKFIASEENKALRQYTQQEEIQGTAPMEASAKSESKPDTASTSTPPAGSDPTKPVQPTVVVSPLEEMNRQPVETPKSAKQKTDPEKTDKNKKTKSAVTKKPAKVASNKEQ